MNNKQDNKALHPTACSFARASLRFRRRVSLSLCCARLRFNVARAWFSGRCSFVACVESFLSDSPVAAASLLLA
jgi:hypothetical protein